MSGTELIMGMEEVINYLKELEAEKKKLQEDLSHVQDNLNENFEFSYFKKMKELKAENKKLKEDLEKAWDQRGDKWRKSRIKNLEEENKKLKEDEEMMLSAVEAMKFMDKKWDKVNKEWIDKDED